MKKKLTARQKAVNRIQRRLRTKQKQGHPLNVVPTKKNIEEILKSQHIRVTDKNINDVVDSVVQKSEKISRQDAKKIKKLLDKKTIKDVYDMTGMELHDKIKELYDEDEDDDAEEILAAYGY